MGFLAVLILIGLIIWEKIDDKYFYPKRLEKHNKEEEELGLK